VGRIGGLRLFKNSNTALLAPPLAAQLAPLSSGRIDGVKEFSHSNTAK
jgi:hypothetical protein